MTATEQTLRATAPEADQAAPGAAKAKQLGTSSNLPAPSASVVPMAAAKAPAKHSVKTPVKKVAETVKSTATGATKPALESATRKALAAIKPVITAAATKIAVKKAIGNPIAKPATSVAPRFAAKSPVKAKPKAVIAALAKPNSDKQLKAKKPKLVRDSFTIPKLEYLVLEELKRRSSILGNPIKKGELIRAGIKALAAMADADFLTALKAVPAIKTGRPAKG